jgi:hypothetical protein
MVSLLGDAVKSYDGGKLTVNAIVVFVANRRLNVRIAVF